MLMTKSKPTTEKAQKLNPLKDPVLWANSLSESDLEREASSLEKQLLLGPLATWHRMDGATVGRCWMQGRIQNREFPEEIDQL
jgi:hypothetical protein